MSRFADLLVGLVALIGILIVQMSGAVIADELRNEFNINADASFNQQQINNDLYTAVAKWVPTVAFVGVLVLIVYREFRRQRVTAIRRGRI